MPLSRSNPASSGAGVNQSFTRFPDLAPEIRRAIWGFASFLPRDIDIFVLRMGEITVNRAFFYPIRLMSPHAVPAMLHTSKEARDVGLNHYERKFGVEQKFPGSTLKSANRIYVNPQVDRAIFFGAASSRACETISNAIYTAVRRIAINVDINEDEMDWSIPIELMQHLATWFDGSNIDEIALYCAEQTFQETVNKGDEFHLEDFNKAKSKTKKGKALLRAKKRLEREAKKFLNEVREWREENPDAGTESGEELPELSLPVIKLVSLIKD